MAQGARRLLRALNAARRFCNLSVGMRLVLMTLLPASCQAPSSSTVDLGEVDQTMPDLVMPDLAMSDLAMPDLAMPDLAMPDLSMPMADLSKPMPDLATACEAVCPVGA